MWYPLLTLLDTVSRTTRLQLLPDLYLESGCVLNVYQAGDTQRTASSLKTPRASINTRLGYVDADDLHLAEGLVRLVHLARFDCLSYPSRGQAQAGGGLIILLLILSKINGCNAHNDFTPSLQTTLCSGRHRVSRVSPDAPGGFLIAGINVTSQPNQRGVHAARHPCPSNPRHAGLSATLSCEG